MVCWGPFVWVGGVFNVIGVVVFAVVVDGLLLRCGEGTYGIA